MEDAPNSTPVTREILDRFFEGLTTDDSERRMTIEQVYVLASHYPKIQKLLEQNAVLMTRVLEKGTTQTEKLKLLEELFGREIRELTESTDGPNRPISKEDVDYKAKSLKEVRDNAERHANRLAQEKSDIARNFAKDLVRSYCQRTLEDLPIDQKNSISSRVEERIAIEVSLDAPLDQVHQKVRSIVDSEVQLVNRSVPAEVAQAAVEETRLTHENLLKTQEKLRIAQSVPETLVLHAGRIDAKLLSRFIEIEENEGVANPIDEAVRLTKAAEVFGLPEAEIRGLLKAGVDISSVLKKAGLEGPGKILEELRPEVQQALVEESFRNLLDNKNPMYILDKLTARLGPDAAVKLTPFIQHANKLFIEEGTSAKAILGKLGNVASDFSDAFKGADDATVAFMEAAYHNIIDEKQLLGLTKKHFVFAAIRVESDAFYPIFNNAGTLSLQWLPSFLGGIPKELGGGAGGPAIVATAEGGAGAAAAGASKGLAARLIAWGAEKGGIWVALTRLVGVALGPIGTAATFVLTTFSGPISGFVGKLIRGEIFGPWAAFTSSAIASLPSLGAPVKREKIPPSVLVPGIGVGCIALLMLPVLLVITSLKGAEVQSLTGAGPGESAVGFIGGTPPDMASDINTCPVQGATITQWPYCSPALKTGFCSHRFANAYDLGVGPSGYGRPVVAAHAGTVAFHGCDGVYEHCQNENPHGAGFGNFVILVGRHTGTNEPYHTIYGHLATISENVLDGVVEAGEEIGTADSTGYSDGNHLHFEYVGPKGNAPFLPPNCP